MPAASVWARIAYLREVAELLDEAPMEGDQVELSRAGDVVEATCYVQRQYRVKRGQATALPA